MAVHACRCRTAHRRGQSDRRISAAGSGPSDRQHQHMRSFWTTTHAHASRLPWDHFRDVTKKPRLPVTLCHGIVTVPAAAGHRMSRQCHGLSRSIRANARRRSQAILLARRPVLPRLAATYPPHAPARDAHRLRCPDPAKWYGRKPASREPAQTGRSQAAGAIQHQHSVTNITIKANFSPKWNTWNTLEHVRCSKV
ncbi:hypothetical protein Fraau_1987 [Frateuria aurantia DSM 6220]|uniref:Uncharacterized protein n=1 Tax=Frateuria aurantia (strain ATCC 33424 / DSM 6220 / KCTC 2777 / LMG 1558 / NBRC 3245 / NCIMB 13370) TaxID=767434 RepID=H8L1W3_FRAAD|nr:hypothetical protein Fraau_1987 [Frateuria aurantia DSM 6220]